ncbi:hypothetical protein PP1_002160 [Pseudonocardia sp. P1]
MRGQLGGTVLLQQVPGVVEPVQGRVRDPLVQPDAVLRRQDPVVAAPQQPQPDRAATAPRTTVGAVSP